MTQPLAGGRWVVQYGSNFDTVLSRSGSAALVQSNSSGSLYEFTFDENGDYRLQWLSTTSLGGVRSRSIADEHGSWRLDDMTLTLNPRAQALHYEANGNTQDDIDKDLTPRRYHVVDIQLETVVHTGAPQRRMSASR